MEITDMFKENNGHLQQSFLTSENYMNPSVHARLLKSWACVFYNAVFCKIKETIFAVLYCENNGRPNFPVNILLSLEYIKHLFDYSDEELIDQSRWIFNPSCGPSTLPSWDRRSRPSGSGTP